MWNRGTHPTVQTIERCVKIPQTQFFDRAVEAPAGVQRQGVMFQTAEKTGRHRSRRLGDKTEDTLCCAAVRDSTDDCVRESVAVAGRGEIPQIVKNIGESVDVEKTMEISQAQLVDKVVEVLVARCVQDILRHAVEKTGEIAQVMTREVFWRALIARDGTGGLACVHCCRAHRGEDHGGHTTCAVDQKSRRHLCRRAETDPSGADDSEDHRDATVPTHGERTAIFLLSSLCRSHMRRSCRRQ